MKPLSQEIKNKILDERRYVSQKDIEEYEKILLHRLTIKKQNKNLPFEEKEKLRFLYKKIFK